jgi:5-methylcytosine-specific restriction protein A
MTETHAFRHEPRQDLTDQQRTKLFLEKKGRCHRCTRKIMSGEKWYDEHVHSLGTGGTNAWSNRDVTCCNCFHPKNAEDAKKLSKQRDIAVAHVIPPSQRQKKGKPLPGTKRSGWKKKLSGEWVRR